MPTRKQAKHSDQILWDSLNYFSKYGNKNRRWVNRDQSDVKCDSTCNENEANKVAIEWQTTTSKEHVSFNSIMTCRPSKASYFISS